MVVLAALLGPGAVIGATGAQAETRTLKLYYTHTRERQEITFKRNGRYVQSGLNELNRFLRDWRSNEPTKMDPELFDLVWEVYQASGARDYIHVVSAYRSPATNSMLRRTRGGQAKKSQHMYGRAMDFFIPGVPTRKLRELGFKLQGGGVGYYPKSATPFVHLDTARVRAWPRMSRSDLTRLFPDGKTLHLPPDGKPLPGYQQALAAYNARKKAGEPASFNRRGGGGGGGLLANIFGRDRDDDTPAATARLRSAPAPAPTRQTPRTLLAALPASAIPLPLSAPRGAPPDPEPEPEPAPMAVAAAAPDTQESPLAEVAPPVPQARPAVLLAAAEAPEQRSTAVELEQTVAGRTEANTDAAAPMSQDDAAAILAALGGTASDDAEPTTELAYAVPVPSRAPRTDIASQAGPALAALSPQASGPASIPAPVERSVAPGTDGKAGRVTVPSPRPRPQPDVVTAALDTGVNTTQKSARPSAEDARNAARLELVPADQIDPARFGEWATSSSALTQYGRQMVAPQFAKNATRALPDTIYNSGFSKLPMPDPSRFSGETPNLMPVARLVAEATGGDGGILTLDIPSAN
ncbi:DUF882 domain-containing protein [Roseitalea sp. MMSF_3516]|nr:DUF882 domain-containing protein [Roseitalea sp. MMSF_3516]